MASELGSDMKINIQTIKHWKQRYPTVGDWWWDGNNDLVIRVSEMKDRRHVILVAFHEMIEAVLCDERGITEQEVTKFDEAFEEHRKEGDLSEPGDDVMAPYYKEHQFATELEHEFADELEVDWKEYESAINSL